MKISTFEERPRDPEDGTAVIASRLGDRGYVPLSYTKLDTKGRCLRVDCNNKVTGRKKYCSKQCSALTRNRHYYETPDGRWKKRAAARRYFQCHRFELYDKRRARMERYVQDLLVSEDPDEFDYDTEMNTTGASAMTRYARIVLGARRLARVQHDWHPTQQGDTPLGRPRWENRHPEFLANFQRQLRVEVRDMKKRA
jgi:hypothetical protein